MRYALVFTATLVGAAAVASGCQIILGLDPVSLAPDGGAGGAGGAPDGGAGGTGGTNPCGSLGSCVSVPEGWSPVALTSAACPSGFGSPGKYLYALSATPFTCACNCPTQACTGTASLDQYPDGTCAGSPTDSISISLSTSCAGQGGKSIHANQGYVLSSVTFGPQPACQANPQPVSHPTYTAKEITVCQPDQVCTGGACLDAAEQGALCVSHAGSMACPAGFPTQTLAAQGAIDSRGCGPCSCGSTLDCTLTKVLIDNDSSCDTSGPYWFNASSTCATATAPGNYGINATQVAATVTGSGCAETAPSKPTGSVDLDPASTVTVCCP